ncbi:hypothetical protein ES332_D11G274900v1 [Gossypium tomentosum]|uniref:Uncharacterized protein n=1 Tax=Gossypium tomentosum TaxID=34277 RepID=A0A5D2ISG8_GOSTO|nr:hypothetical protein ES332_D11G274900v1 [Gossypium tomentosum]
MRCLKVSRNPKSNRTSEIININRAVKQFIFQFVRHNDVGLEQNHLIMFCL